MSVVDEINKDLEKLGGDTSGQTIEEAMDKFGDKVAEKIGEATELPEVSSDDNGSILKVVDGAWAKGEETKELPEVTSEDEEDILMVGSDGTWKKTANQVQWIYLPENELEPGATLEKVNEKWKKEGSNAFNFGIYINNDAEYRGLPYSFITDEDEENIEQLDVYITTNTGVVIKKTFTSEGVTTTTLSNNFVVTFTASYVESGKPYSYTADKSIQDILDAYFSGKNVYGIVSISEELYSRDQWFGEGNTIYDGARLDLHYYEIEDEWSSGYTAVAFGKKSIFNNLYQATKDARDRYVLHPDDTASPWCGLWGQKGDGTSDDTWVVAKSPKY